MNKLDDIGPTSHNLPSHQSLKGPDGPDYNVTGGQTPARFVRFSIRIPGNSDATFIIPNNIDSDDRTMLMKVLDAYMQLVTIKSRGPKVT
jgi:hypothetical protein